MDDRIEAMVAHRFAFSADQVFESWLRPDAIQNWMGPALMALGLPGELKVIEVDPRIGGRFCFSDNRSMGEVFHWGTYKQLDSPTCIAFTWNAGLKCDETDNERSLVTISITPSVTGCDLKLVHLMEAQWKDHLQRTENGWKNMLTHIDQSLISRSA